MATDRQELEQRQNSEPGPAENYRANGGDIEGIRGVPTGYFPLRGVSPNRGRQSIEAGRLHLK
jgi:hypothetical protein